MSRTVKGSTAHAGKPNAAQANALKATGRMCARKFGNIMVQSLVGEGLTGRQLRLLPRNRHATRDWRLVHEHRRTGEFALILYANKPFKSLQHDTACTLRWD
jgi:hypothetical protein